MRIIIFCIELTIAANAGQKTFEPARRAQRTNHGRTLLICTQDSLFASVSTVRTTEYTEWQWPLSGIHSIMMVKSAQSGEGSVCTPRALPLSLYLPSQTKLWYTLQVRGQILYISPISPLPLYVRYGQYPLLFACFLGGRGKHLY
jgi:hypothetical protein